MEVIEFYRISTSTIPYVITAIYNYYIRFNAEFEQWFCHQKYVNRHARKYIPAAFSTIIYYVI